MDQRPNHQARDKRFLAGVQMGVGALDDMADIIEVHELEGLQREHDDVAQMAENLGQEMTISKLSINSERRRSYSRIVGGNEGVGGATTELGAGSPKDLRRFRGSSACFPGGSSLVSTNTTQIGSPAPQHGSCSQSSRSTAADGRSSTSSAASSEPKSAPTGWTGKPKTFYC
ncbi:Protein CBG27536 [Caenorhabditis briggsae]|uniref:Protein CBG27536 n=1 Tax=Caenorhabditis briggsae TaxID=6238 RepID=B6IKJ7_CAEBR|nr:Protein CBG27536 [Caenorhabditis briggsae]CAS00427.1 Protein CBG27536 [Caenorhabditis briggsae]